MSALISKVNSREQILSSGPPTVLPDKDARRKSCFPSLAARRKTCSFTMSFSPGPGGLLRPAMSPLGTLATRMVIQEEKTDKEIHEEDENVFREEEEDEEAK